MDISKNGEIALTKTATCAGCAAKLDPSLLRQVLNKLGTSQDPKLLVGAESMDDAGVYKLTEDMALITTTDFFPPIVDDPRLFGQIAATNAMSDVFAMGGEVLTALNILSYPTALGPEVLGDILEGAKGKVEEASGLVVGGHTIAQDSLVFGLAVTGLVNPGELTTNSAAKVGDALILTKPLGTGIITTAIKRGLLGAEAGEQAFFTMTQLNDKAAHVMRKGGVRAATDITGFGLLGHCLQMARASKVTIELIANNVPLLEQVMALAERDIVTGASERNGRYVSDMIAIKGQAHLARQKLLLDPQTSGGLLIAVAPQKVDSVLRGLFEFGYKYSAIVGSITEMGDRPLVVKY